MPASSAFVYLRGYATAVPSRRVPVATVLAEEHERVQRQLEPLTAGLRERLLAQLGIETLPVHDGAPSELALTAVERALSTGELDARSIDLVIDFSTMPGDHPGIWSLAHRVQALLPDGRAEALGVHGSGCAGFHVALRTAIARLAAGATTALLVSADRVPAGGRVCLPISVMSDAGCALVLSRQAPTRGPRVRLRGVALATVGVLHDILRVAGSPHAIEIDAERFERQVLPIHYVLCQRVLTQALRESGRTLAELNALIYPNTTALDRQGLLRALGLEPTRLVGPGPLHHGHAFAADMFVNLPPLAGLARGAIAWLAAGSGFTWGAAIADVEPAA